MDDLISRFRDYQIEWLTSHNDIEFCEEEEKLIIGFLKDTAESFMRENQSAQQWIPCSERLPEKFGDYLVSVKRHGWNCEEHIENDIAFWDDLEGFHKAEEVLAWMPLPEPYKEENAND